jgi:hypothetical protein
MKTTAVTFNLPEDLAREGLRRELLTDSMLMRWLEDAIAEQKREAGDNLLAMIAELHALEPRITPEEIDAEVAAYRAEQAAKRELEQSMLQKTL